MISTETIKYYSDLLIRQYRMKPKAVADIQAEVTPIIMPMSDGNILPLAVQNAFDMDTAVGVQLDTLGTYIGVTRQGSTFSGSTTLGDEDYKKLLHIVAQRNVLRADLSSIQDFFYNNFRGLFQVTDNLNMNMTYTYLGKTGENIVAEFFIEGGFLPVPSCVYGDLTYTVDYFGFDEDPKALGFAEDSGMVGFDSSVGGAFISGVPRANFATEYYIIVGNPTDFGFDEDPDAQGFAEDSGMVGFDSSIGGQFSRLI
jgi:hypothetical protein